MPGGNSGNSSSRLGEFFCSKACERISVSIEPDKPIE